MRDSHEAGTLTVELDALRSHWEKALDISLPPTSSIAALNVSLPETVDEKTAVLEGHLRASLAGMIDMDTDPIDFSATPAVLAEILRFAREARSSVRTARKSDVARNPCDDAAAFGIILISVGCGIHPIAGVVGFAIGVELLLESC